MHVPGGGFHLKAATLFGDDGRAWFAAKLNANFPGNPREHGLPTIQGMLILSDARVGTPLAVMDSSALTIIRTAAATAVAARHLARRDASVVAMIGCGAQARAQLEAVGCVRPIREIRLFDANIGAAERLSESLAGESRSVATLRDATLGADIVITCTPSRSPFLSRDDLSAGAFVAAVGTDNEEKSEIEPSLMREAAVVVDSLEQCERIGDLHHAIDAGVMTRDDVCGDLSALVCGKVNADREGITIFDSTGVAIEDVAAAKLVYERAASPAGAYGSM
jgi:ornithine cyclodeaminase/alanine dehydrogenase-like protein (mu-crystallin family)